MNHIFLWKLKINTPKTPKSKISRRWPYHYVSSHNFDFRISTIREWIEQELQIPNLPFEYDLENIIDDWVLLCFFVGNDFLPHLPSLDIKEGAIDKLVGIYKSKLWFRSSR